MLKGNYKVTFSYSESHYCLVSISRLNSFSYNESHYCLASISRLNSSCKMFLGKKLEIFHFIPRLSQLSRDCFATKCFSQKPQCVSRLISQLPNSWKMRVFNFYVVDVTVFQIFCFPSHCLSRTPLNAKSIFTQTPSFSSKYLCKISSRYVFLHIVFIFVLDYVDFSLGFWNLGIFKKGLGFLFLCKFFQNFD